MSPPPSGRAKGAAWFSSLWDRYRVPWYRTLPLQSPSEGRPEHPKRSGDTRSNAIQITHVFTLASVGHPERRPPCRDCIVMDRRLEHPVLPPIERS
jgi:hypothetical protein